MTITQEIKQCIEEQLDKGKKKFIVFPFGDIGIQAKNILSEVYGIEVEYILDNHLSQYNSKIKPLSFLKEISCDDYVLILSIINREIYNDIREKVLEYISEDNLAELSSMVNCKTIKKYTKVGKYSYGPLCNNRLVESVGAFCSFAEGSDAVQNHAVDYLSTHPFIYRDKEVNAIFDEAYSEWKHTAWYFEGITPKGVIRKTKKSKIGNDVWLGKNVTITNGANIGNGVIAGAGAVITKDVPDYAIVAGVPAKIIKYRYTNEQIEALNRIQWWNWSDETIKERYDDLFIDIEDFIEKYDKKQE